MTSQNAADPGNDHLPTVMPQEEEEARDVFCDWDSTDVCIRLFRGDMTSNIHAGFNVLSRYQKPTRINN